MRTEYKYILDDDGNPKPCFDLTQWADWMESHERHVANDIFEGVHVSTVFLGIDHNFGFDASPPVLFETMIFGGPMDGFMDRYHTREEALQGHADALTLVKLELEMKNE